MIDPQHCPEVASKPQLTFDALYKSDALLHDDGNACIIGTLPTEQWALRERNCFMLQLQA